MAGKVRTTLTPNLAKNASRSCFASPLVSAWSSIPAGVKISSWAVQNFWMVASKAFVAKIQIVFEQSTLLRFLRSWYSP